jgi:hypothetical protein
MLNVATPSDTVKDNGLMRTPPKIIQPGWHIDHAPRPASPQPVRGMHAA